MDLLKTLRSSLRGSWPPWGSLRHKSKAACFTLSTNDVYRFPLNDEETQPDNAFYLAQSCFGDIQTIMANPSPAEEDTLESFLIKSFTNLIFGSNAIERAGCGYELTVRLCRKVVAGKEVLLEPRTSEYQDGPVEMVTKPEK